MESYMYVSSSWPLVNATWVRVYYSAAGILLVVYPPLLSLIVAIVLMLTGVAVISIAYQERKLKRHHRNPVIEFIIRY